MTKSYFLSWIEKEQDYIDEINDGNLQVLFNSNVHFFCELFAAWNCRRLSTS